MRHEDFLRSYPRQFELKKIMGSDEWEQPEQIAGSLTEGQVIPWIIFGALLLCCGNIVYACIELLKST